MPLDQSNQTTKFMKGAFILTLAAFIVKILSAAYRVPFQNIVGDIGFYIYQQVYPIYGIGLILATSGFPVILSKLAVESGDGKRRPVAHAMQAAFLTLLFVGAFLFSICYFTAEPIATLMGDRALTPLIRWTAWIFLLLPFISLWRGYFQSVGNMVPTAVSQVVEQLLRVTVILISAVILTQKGVSLYKVGEGAIIGSVIGGVAAVLLLFAYALKKRATLIFLVKGMTFKKFYKTAQIVLIHGTLISLSGMLLILFQLADSFTLYSGLVQSGVEESMAKELKGVFDRGQPLIQLGTVLASSFSLAVVPLITAAWMKDDHKLIHLRTSQALNITMIICAGAAIGLMNIMGAVNTMLFANDSGTAVLTLLATSIFFSSLIMVSSGVLQGLGNVFDPPKHILIGLVLKWVFNYVFIPVNGLFGAALSTVLALSVVMVCMLLKLNKHIDILHYLNIQLRRLLPALLMMTVVLQLWKYMFSFIGAGRMISTALALSSVCIGLSMYVWMVIKKGLLTKEELEFIPFGNKLQSILKGSDDEK